MATTSKNKESAEPLLAPEMISIPPQEEQTRSITASLRPESDSSPDRTAKRSLPIVFIFRGIVACLCVTNFGMAVFEVNRSRWYSGIDHSYAALAAFAMIDLAWQGLAIFAVLSRNSPCIRVTITINNTKLALCGSENDDLDRDEDGYGTKKLIFWKTKKWGAILVLGDLAWLAGIVGAVIALLDRGGEDRVIATGIVLMIFQSLTLITQAVPFLRRLAIVYLEDEQYEYQIVLDPRGKNGQGHVYA